VLFQEDIKIIINNLKIKQPMKIIMEGIIIISMKLLLVEEIRALLIKAPTKDDCIIDFFTMSPRPTGPWDRTTYIPMQHFF
jgi:hypothetical protein